MAWDHALKKQTSHNIYLFMASFDSKICHLNSGDGDYKSERGGGGSSQSATPPVRNKKKTKKPITLIYCE